MEISRMRYPTNTVRVLPPKRKKLSKKTTFIALGIFIVGVLSYTYAYAAIHKPLRVFTIPSVSLSSKVTVVPVDWPTGVDAAVGSLTTGVLAQSKTVEEPRSIASIAKVITAIAVMRKKPITSTTETIITFTNADQALYEKYATSDGSNIAVSTGDQLSEYQALEAMLLPSANNMADSLAIWAFGSLDSYTTYANDMVRSFGLTKTSVGEASGFNDTVLSTPSELIVLGQKLMADPLLAQIVKEQSTTLPTVGIINNTNQLLNSGASGIKTGHTATAGYCLLLIKNYQISATYTTSIITAVLGASTAEDSFVISDGLVTNAQKNFGTNQVIPKHTAISIIQTPWGNKSTIETSVAVVAYGWKAMPRKAITKPMQIKAPAKAGSIVGLITTFNDGGYEQNYDIVLASAIYSPSVWWRLTHYF